eukprot:TRINITY_DN9536_c0_g1_i12.p1 TRINITY_DN9536_c0_g1~~TRINITY_DN9536_c0_g1_i12.p1  ORF type:complete len:157 (+),score=22.76 TRINITY_DN9536_c0_g1_i12:134-604(+)
MGKELEGAARTNLKKTLTFRTGQNDNIWKEIDTQWTPCSPLTAPKVLENGRALITLVQGNAESKVLCTGFTRTGNRYTRLIKALRRKGYIPTGAKVRGVMRDKKFVNVRVNARKESFWAGDKIIIQINSKGKGGIREMERRKEEEKLMSGKTSLTK